MTRYTGPEVARGAFGALLGIAVAGATAQVLPGGPEMLPFIVAPMGASAVLLFAAPASRRPPGRRPTGIPARAPSP